MPVAHDRTVYLFLGDWFAWVSVALLVFAMSRLLLAKQSRLGYAIGTDESAKLNPHGCDYVTHG